MSDGPRRSSRLARTKKPNYSYETFQKEKFEQMLSQGAKSQSQSSNEQTSESSNPPTRRLNRGRRQTATSKPSSSLLPSPSTDSLVLSQKQPTPKGILGQSVKSDDASTSSESLPPESESDNNNNGPSDHGDDEQDYEEQVDSGNEFREKLSAYEAELNNHLVEVGEVRSSVSKMKEELRKMNRTLKDLEKRTVELQGELQAFQQTK